MTEAVAWGRSGLWELYAASGFQSSSWRGVCGGVVVPMLKVDLQEEFSDATIVLLLNGKEIYRGTPKTRLQIGLPTPGLSTYHHNI